MIMGKPDIKKFAPDFLFRFGLASFFLVNSLTAWFSPSEFAELLSNNPLASSIASPKFWIFVIGINDSLLFLFILLGCWHKITAWWAGFWIVIVIYVTGLEPMELIEHLGLLSLIVYYYFTFKPPLVRSRTEQKKQAVRR